MFFNEGIVGDTILFIGFKGFKAHAVCFVVGGYGGYEMAGGEDVEGGEDYAVYLED